MDRQPNELEQRIELIEIERDALFLHCASGSFLRWKELDESKREQYRQKAARARKHMQDYES